MQRAQEASASERMWNEAALRERRLRVLRAAGLVAGVFLVGLAAVALAKAKAPDAFDGAAAFLTIGTCAALLRVRRVADRHWRCPVCDTRWETQDALASFQWNHCAACGAPLRAYPRQRERERVAGTAFALEALSPEALVARFERHRRRAMWRAGAVATVGIAVLLWVMEQGFGDLAEQCVAAGLAAGVAGLMIWGSRCPRCQTGILGAGRHCQRCGLSLPEDASPHDPLTR